MNSHMISRSLYIYCVVAVQALVGKQLIGSEIPIS